MRRITATDLLEHNAAIMRDLVEHFAVPAEFLKPSRELLSAVAIEMQLREAAPRIWQIRESLKRFEPETWRWVQFWLYDEAMQRAIGDTI